MSPLDRNATDNREFLSCDYTRYVGFLTCMREFSGWLGLLARSLVIQYQGTIEQECMYAYRIKSSDERRAREREIVLPLARNVGKTRQRHPWTFSAPRLG